VTSAAGRAAAAILLRIDIERAHAVHGGLRPSGRRPLKPDRLSGHILATSPECAMEGKAKFVFPFVITAIIVFVVSAVVTFFNIGLRADFVTRWLSAFIVGWPVAAVTAYLALPVARTVTLRIVSAIEGTA
jgi:Protein of unknown function (DUF2798)